jgi:hypothetical protein
MSQFLFAGSVSEIEIEIAVVAVPREMSLWFLEIQGSLFPVAIFTLASVFGFPDSLARV